MKKVTAVFKVLLMAMLITSLSIVSVSAAEITGEEISLITQDSGYKIIVPGFIEFKTVELDGIDVNVVVMETPEKDSNGTYPIFEIVTTDPNAYYAESYPGTYMDGQLGNFEGKFEEGRLLYSPEFAIKDDLKDISEDTVFVFDFDVYDEAYENIFSVVNIYFMFENKEEATAPIIKTATAEPTTSKVVVNGKEVAFEAYLIGGNNYFKLRDLAMVVNKTQKQFQVGWDSAKNAIDLTSQTAYTPAGNELAVSKNPTAKVATSTQSKIYLNGEEVQFTAYNIGGNNYFKLRDIAQVIDFAVTWNGTLKMIGIDTADGYTVPE